jgi:5'-3' exoribonuclease 1
MTFTFELGVPFLPFQQLMGVLPEASKELIPVAYRVCPLRLFIHPSLTA